MAYTVRNLRRLASLVVLATLTPAGIALAADAPAAKRAPAAAPADAGNNGAVPYGWERGVTKPIHEPKQSFNVPGIVDKLLVKEGDPVVANQTVLAELDTTEERAKMTELEGEVKGAMFQIDAALADHKAKVVAHQRKKALYAEQLARDPNFSNSELDEARVAEEIAVIAMKFRNHEKDQKELEKKNLQIKMDLKKLVSRVTGVVSQIDVHPGEAADLSKPAITVIQYDKLYVEVDIPVAKARKIKKDDPLKVCYTDDYNEQGDKPEIWYNAKVIFLTPYADASSGTRKVRLEMDNTTEKNPAPIREAGLTVYVRVPDSAAAASTR